MKENIVPPETVGAVLSHRAASLAQILSTQWRRKLCTVVELLRGRYVSCFETVKGFCVCLRRPLVDVFFQCAKVEL